jgi:hypothetical protein
MNSPEKVMYSYRAMVDNFPGFIFRCSADCRIAFMNKWMIDEIGYDATGNFCHKVLHDLDTPCPWCVNERVFAGETVYLEIHSSNVGKWFYGVSMPVCNSMGTVF